MGAERARFTSNVLGPHFEQLCRYWTRYFAPEEITGGFPARVEPGIVKDPASKKTRQVDVAAFAVDGPADLYAGILLQTCISTPAAVQLRDQQ